MSALHILADNFDVDVSDDPFVKTDIDSKLVHSSVMMQRWYALSCRSQCTCFLLSITSTAHMCLS